MQIWVMTSSVWILRRHFAGKPVKCREMPAVFSGYRIACVAGRDRSREAGKFWMSGCEDVGKAARMVTSPPKLSKAQKQLRKLCTLARGGQFEPTTNSTQHTTFPPGYATWPPGHNSLKEVTHVNWKWMFFIHGQCFCQQFRANRLCKSKDTWQNECGSVKEY